MGVKVWSFVVGLLLLPHTQTVELSLANKVLASSVLIHAKVFRMGEDLEIKKGMIGCSGTYVSEGTVLTAAHCFSEATMGIWVRDYHGKSHEAYLIKIDPSHDLALLAVKGPYRHSTSRIAENLRIGEKVVNVGSPVGFEFLVSEGIVASTKYTDKHFKSNYVITTAMINSGSSGGGAFNALGELIGVNTMSAGGLFGWAGISMAVSIDDIRRFLQ